MAMQLLKFNSEVEVFGIDGFCNNIVSYRQPMKLMAQRVIELLAKQRIAGDKWKSIKVFEKGVICEKEL
jgi:hypothetical protein